MIIFIDLASTLKDNFLGLHIQQVVCGIIMKCENKVIPFMEKQTIIFICYFVFDYSEVLMFVKVWVGCGEGPIHSHDFGRCAFEDHISKRA